MNLYVDDIRARLPHRSTTIPVSTNLASTNGIIHGKVTRIEETTTRVIHFAHDNNCDTANIGELMPIRSPTLKIAPRKIQILHHEYDGLKQTTKDQIKLVYDRTMAQNTLGRAAFSSYSGICQALRFLGVGIFEYDKNGFAMPEDLLANWVHERNKLLFNWYGADPYTRKSLKEQASRCYWGFDELKVITARWMQGRDEDKLLEPGRKLMNIDERNTRLEEIRIRDLKKERGEAEVKELIREGLTKSEGRYSVGSKIQMDAETLEMIKGIKEAHDVFARQAARLLAHVVNVPDFTDSPRLPQNRRLEGPKPVNYPWSEAKKRGRQ